MTTSLGVCYVAQHKHKIPTVQKNSVVGTYWFKNEYIFIMFICSSLGQCYVKQCSLYLNNANHKKENFQFRYTVIHTEHSDKDTTLMWHAEVDWECSINAANKKYVHNCCLTNFLIRGTVKKILLKWILEAYTATTYTGFNCIKIWWNGEVVWSRLWTIREDSVPWIYNMWLLHNSYKQIECCFYWLVNSKSCY